MKIGPLCAALLFCSYVRGDEPSKNEGAQKRQILYLAKAQNYQEALDLYVVYKEEIGKHDFELLQEMAVSWIEESTRNRDPKKQLIGIFSLGLSGIAASVDILEPAVGSPDPDVQRATVQYLGRMQEDVADSLLNKAMSSNFLYTRLEAAFYLAERKSRSAAGQIESLMYRLPPEIRYFFPEFFAKIGTTEAIATLRHLMDDPFSPTKTEAILSAARHGRDDLLPLIRAAVTHPDGPEQEAGAAALGYLRDMRSIKKLKKLMTHSSDQVRLSACNALHSLGDLHAAKEIAREARAGNLFAVGLLGNIQGEEASLISLLDSSNKTVRFNAAAALLQRRDKACIPVLRSFLVDDDKDLGFRPIASSGGSLQAWKVVSSGQKGAQDGFVDLGALTVAVKEHLIGKAALLQESVFLSLAEACFSDRQNELVPALVSAIESLGTPESISFLRVQAQRAGAPLIRAYCNLALFRITSEPPYADAVLKFIEENISRELIRFRASLPWNMRLSDTYSLTPEESSSLLIGAYEALIGKQSSSGIDLLLRAIRSGNPENRAVLSAVLVQALQ